MEAELDAGLFEAAPHLNGSWRRKYIAALLTWFEQHRRDLPWRRTRDAYAIWISESMLQQTQVSTVIGYYERFLARFPDVQSLAQASEQEVLSLWAGLGYYRRARQLHQAAKKVVEQHAGLFPSTVTDLMGLPGVGRYTAGAVASIAHGVAAPIVEANTQRLYARLIGLEEDLQTPRAARILWQFAQWQLQAPAQKTAGSNTTGSKATGRQANLDRDTTSLAGNINQAAMELGSLVCKPVGPACLVCPVVALCPTARLGKQDRIPSPKPRKQFSSLHHVAYIIQRTHRQRLEWLLRLNPTGAWWAGLWDFPRVDVTSLTLRATSQSSRSRLQLDSAQQAGIGQLTQEQLGLAVVISPDGSPWSLSHGVTRYRITVDCLSAELLQPQLPGDGWKWVRPDDLDGLPLTSPATKIANRLLASIAR